VDQRRVDLQRMIVEGQLAETMSSERVAWWWKTPAEALGGFTPAEALSMGRFREVLELVWTYE
jgi:hypothetical protein